ncbi:MAG: lipase family protein [Gammaproteobacteria bacterium]|nr:lipase family protein [Gammaproteobacteria bacterium]
MNLLTPGYAAVLANGVYGVNENPLLSAQKRVRLVGCEPDFSIPRPDHGDRHPFARSTTGGLPIPGVAALAESLKPEIFAPVETDFGYVAMGNAPSWHGHMLVVTRGTMGPKGISPDWLSNYNIGLKTGPDGRLVHAGFYRAWQEMSSFVHRAVEQYRPAHIHCVGHSLGGALANLNALSLAQSGYDVALYTFGAPRVGALDFATELSVRLRERVKRVYHPADPVPMIPLLPFLHAPLTYGIRLTAPAGALIDADAHDMELSYQTLVGGREWDALERANTLLGDFQIDSWLQQAAKQRGGFVLASAALLERIAKGLSRLIKKAVFYVVGSGVSAAATATLTALDFVAWLLSRAAAIANAIREEITGLVNAIFGFLGRIGSSIADLTQSALRWVLGLLFTYLANQARNALERLI